ncbi:hypothetical protein OUZ56_028933 [Daphnia magna]|uniref:Uncharacterized protein n=1 Tax=Daphnia magna TaxID=35525 RepID=A0ABR0B5C3_9CRUS|nr:hypothetical protein OUZ56_028933 [Daphnia magna]
MAVPTLCPVFTIHRLNIILKSSFLHFSVLVCAPSTDHRRFARFPSPCQPGLVFGQGPPWSAILQTRDVATVVSATYGLHGLAANGLTSLFGTSYTTAARNATKTSNGMMQHVIATSFLNIISAEWHLLCCPSYQRSCQGEICFQTKDLMYDTWPVLRYQIKVHTRMIDAKLNKEYSFTVNSTLEYICQYSYKQDLLENQSVSHSNALVDLLPPEADSSISMLGADEKPSVSYADIGEMDMQKQEMREAVRSH